MPVKKDTTFKNPHVFILKSPEHIGLPFTLRGNFFLRRISIANPAALKGVYQKLHFTPLLANNPNIRRLPLRANAR